MTTRGDSGLNCRLCWGGNFSVEKRHLLIWCILADDGTKKLEMVTNELFNRMQKT